MQSERKESPTGCCVQGHSGEKDVGLLEPEPRLQGDGKFKTVSGTEQEQGGFSWEVLRWQ
jgi:hypothetical protein